MPLYTNAINVAKVVEIEPEIGADDFITIANALVEEHCVPAGYDATRLELIERYLAAHFYKIRDPQLSGESVGGAISETRATKIDLGLRLTHWGQQALILDTAGGLSLANDNKKAVTPGMWWLGKGTDVTVEVPD